MRSTAFAEHPDYEVRVIPVRGRVRVRFAGATLADSSRARLVLESEQAPVYYFPREDVQLRYLEPSPRHTHCPFKGDACYWSVRVGERVAEDAVWSYEKPFDQVAELAGHVAFCWDRVDAWFVDGERIDAPRKEDLA